MIWLGYLKIFHEQIYSNNSKINFKKNNETIWFVKLTERLVNFKLSQNIWNKIQKSSKIWQYKKSLISTIQCFLTVVAKIQCLEEILDTISRVSQIAVKVGGGMGWGGIRTFTGKIFYRVKGTCGEVTFSKLKQLSVSTEHQLKSKLTWHKYANSMKLKQKWNKSNAYY